MAKQPKIVYNDFQTDAVNNNMFAQHVNDSGLANDYGAYQARQQAYSNGMAAAQDSLGGYAQPVEQPQGLSQQLNAGIQQPNATVGNGFFGHLTDSAAANFFGVFGEADEKALTAEIAADDKKVADIQKHALGYEIWFTDGDCIGYPTMAEAKHEIERRFL